jgi:hypothetical protein
MVYKNNINDINAGNNLASDDRLRWVEMVSRLMDNQFQVPGTNYRFGLDPILGLIPFGGSVASFAVSAGLLLTMVKHGVSRKVWIMMLGNLALDAIFGSIPILGTIFDFAFKANQRNVSLLRKHYQQGKYQGSGNGLIAIIVLVLLIILFLVIYGTWQLIQYIIGLF